MAFGGLLSCQMAKKILIFNQYGDRGREHKTLPLPIAREDLFLVFLYQISSVPKDVPWYAGFPRMVLQQLLDIL